MIVITAPIVEPVTLQEALFHLKIITDPADTGAYPQGADVQGMIGAAREFAEQFCQRAFAEATYEVQGAGFDVPLLAPVTAINEVRYLDADGAEQILGVGVYELNSTAPALRLKIGQAWPAIYSRDDAVRVEFDAGPASVDVPFLVKAAMLLIVGSLNTNLESVSAVQTFTLPMRVQDLLQPYRLGLGV